MVGWTSRANGRIWSLIGLDDIAEELLRGTRGRGERLRAGQEVARRRTEVAGDLVGADERLVGRLERAWQQPDYLAQALLLVGERPEDGARGVDPLGQLLVALAELGGELLEGVDQAGEVLAPLSDLGA